MTLALRDGVSKALRSSFSINGGMSSHGSGGGLGGGGGVLRSVSMHGSPRNGHAAAAAAAVAAVSSSSLVHSASYDVSHGDVMNGATLVLPSQQQQALYRPYVRLPVIPEQRDIRNAR